MKLTSKIGPPLQIFLAPHSPLPLKITWNFFDDLSPWPQLMLNRIWYQASKPELEFHIINIMYAALPMRAHTEKTTFSCKDNWLLTKPIRCWTYSALRLHFNLAVLVWGESNFLYQSYNYFVSRWAICPLTHAWKE